MLTGIELEATLGLNYTQLKSQVEIVVNYLIGNSGALGCIEGASQVLKMEEYKG